MVDATTPKQCFSFFVSCLLLERKKRIPTVRTRKRKTKMHFSRSQASMLRAANAARSGGAEECVNTLAVWCSTAHSIAAAEECGVLKAAVWVGGQVRLHRGLGRRRHGTVRCPCTRGRNCETQERRSIKLTRAGSTKMWMTSSKSVLAPRRQLVVRTTTQTDVLPAASRSAASALQELPTSTFLSMGQLANTARPDFWFVCFMLRAT